MVFLVLLWFFYLFVVVFLQSDWSDQIYFLSFRGTEEEWLILRV